MIAYLTRRIVRVIVTVLLVVFILFMLLSSLPGSRLRSMPSYGGGDALDKALEFFNAGDGLFTKYLRYCYNVLTKLDFGVSPLTNRQIADNLFKYGRVTTYILVISLALALLIGIPAGAFTAVTKSRTADKTVSIVMLALSSIPSYTIAMMIVLVIVVRFKLLPMNYSTVTPRALLMPALTLILSSAASIARMVRASMRETLEEPFITALRAKGLREDSVVYRHALKNALIPIISTLKGFTVRLLCGTFVIEHFFNIHGLGLFLLRSVNDRYHMEILGCTTIIAFGIAIVSIICDLLYSLADPQIKLL